MPYSSPSLISLLIHSLFQSVSLLLACLTLLLSGQLLHSASLSWVLTVRAIPAHNAHRSSFHTSKDVFIYLFGGSWSLLFSKKRMFYFSAPLPHLTSDDVDKALQNSPRLMHARNTGKETPPSSTFSSSSTPSLHLAWPPPPHALPWHPL